MKEDMRGKSNRSTNSAMTPLVPRYEMKEPYIDPNTNDLHNTSIMSSDLKNDKDKKEELRNKFAQEYPTFLK